MCHQGTEKHSVFFLIPRHDLANKAKEMHDSFLFAYIPLRSVTRGRRRLRADCLIDSALYQISCPTPIDTDVITQPAFLQRRPCPAVVNVVPFASDGYEIETAAVVVGAH